MTKKMAWAVALGLTLAMAGPAAAQNKVYKWTDENGVVHFSKTPPPEGQAEQVRLRRAPPAAAEAAAQAEASAGSEDQELFAESDQPDNSGIERENRERACQKGRNMIEQIEPRPRVFRVDAEGNRTYLSDEERLDLLEEARQLIADNC